MAKNGNGHYHFVRAFSGTKKDGSGDTYGGVELVYISDQGAQAVTFWPGKKIAQDVQNLGLIPLQKVQIDFDVQHGPRGPRSELVGIAPA